MSTPVEPLVSVIMAVYNGEHYLREAVNSILSQTLSHLELIIVDDASTDGTAQVLAGFRDSRIRTTRNPYRVGPAAARNRAIAMARAPLLATQDADDISFPHRLQTQVEFLASTPSVSLVGARAASISEEGRQCGVLTYPPTHDLDIRWALLFWNPFIHSSVMFRRSALDSPEAYNQNGELAWLAEDYELFSRISRKHCSANLPELLVKYRINPAGASARPGDLQRLSEEVSRSNISWLLGREVDLEILRALRGFWVQGRPLSAQSAHRALVGSKPLLQAFLSHYLGRETWIVPRTRFCWKRARRAFSLARHSPQLGLSCRGAMLLSSLAIAARAIA